MARQTGKEPIASAPLGDPYGEGIRAGHEWWAAGGDLPTNPYEDAADREAWELGFCHGSGDAEAMEYEDP